ncbi:MAG: hypothetical protein J6582_10745, partial [Snodgrassella sp.]
MALLEKIFIYLVLQLSKSNIYHSRITKKVKLKLIIINPSNNYRGDTNMSNKHFSADAPVSSKEEDKFSRWKFAERV